MTMRQKTIDDLKICIQLSMVFYLSLKGRIPFLMMWPLDDLSFTPLPKKVTVDGVIQCFEEFDWVFNNGQLPNSLKQVQNEIIKQYNGVW